MMKIKSACLTAAKLITLHFACIREIRSKSRVYFYPFGAINYGLPQSACKSINTSPCGFFWLRNFGALCLARCVFVIQKLLAPVPPRRWGRGEVNPAQLGFKHF